MARNSPAQSRQYDTDLSIGERGRESIASDWMTLGGRTCRKATGGMSASPVATRTQRQPTRRHCQRGARFQSTRRAVGVRLDLLRYGLCDSQDTQREGGTECKEPLLLQLVAGIIELHERILKENPQKVGRIFQLSQAGTSAILLIHMKEYRHESRPVLSIKR